MKRAPDVIKGYDIKIAKTDVVDWLRNMNPYTNRLVSNIEANGLGGENSWISYNYNLYLNEIKSTNEELVLRRFNSILDLLTQNKKLFLKKFSELDKEIHTAQKNMSIMTAESQSIISAQDKFTKDTIVRMNLNYFRKMIEGVMDHLANPIIFLLESKKGLNPNLKEIKSRYFSKKYFSDNPNKCSFKKDFPLFYLDFDKGIRNSEAHFDYEIDCQKEIIIYKTGTRQKPKEAKIKFEDFEKMANSIAEISRQITIAYQIFLSENEEDVPKWEIDFGFEQLITALAINSLSHGFMLDNYELNKNKLKFNFINYSDKSFGEAHLSLLRFALNYLSISNKCYNSIDLIELTLDNSAYLCTKISDIKIFKKNPSKPEFDILVRKSLASVKRI